MFAAHCLFIGTRVADLHHLDAIDADPYPAHHQSESNLRLMVYRSCTAPCLHASIVRAHGHSWLHFESIQLLNFNFNPVDPDAAFYSKTDPDSVSQNNLGPCRPES